jgi:hypothetical protein
MVVKKAPARAWTVFTLVFGKKIYISVAVSRTMKKGTTYRIRNAVIRPIRNSGKTWRSVFRSGISEVAAKETISMMMIKVMIRNEMTNDHMTCRLFCTLNMTCRAFSMEANT